MQPTVLLAYATRSGSTEEVIRAIAEVLSQKGLSSEVRPVKEVETIAGYGLVVLGAPLYMGRLLKEARTFLKTHQQTLMVVPIALFVLGPTQDSEKDWNGARQQLKRELKRFPWLLPVATHVVGGKFDPAKLGIPFKWIPALKKIPVSDLRDWPTIQRFAAELAVSLSLPSPQ